MDPETVYEETKALLADRPEFEEELKLIVEVDEQSETWTFEDIPSDSGVFGELISHGIVEKVNNKYRLADREAIKAALADEPLASAHNVADSDRGLKSTFGIKQPYKFSAALSNSFPTVAGLVGALLLVVAVRLIPYRSVLQESRVVSPANDPYYYRYVQNEMLELAEEHSTIGVFAEMPETGTRPLTHALNWWFAELLGGTPEAADQVAAWLPVIASVFLGIIIYLLSTVLTNDRRIGIASVGLYALTPVHAVYTSLGFLEHRLHQYLWLGVLALILTWLAVDMQRRLEKSRKQDGLQDPTRAVRSHLQASQTWGGVALLAVVVGMTPHFWGGSPLIFVPVALYIGLRAVIDVQAEMSPIFAGIPLIVGFSIGSVLAYLPHTWWGWHEPFVVYTPALVAGGAVCVLAAAELWRWKGWLPSGLFAAEVVVGVGGLVLLWLLRPEQAARLSTRADSLFFREGATETASLFALDSAIVFGPLVQLGIGFYLALVPLAWASWLVYRRYQPGWLVAVTFTWYLIALAALQVRFAAHLTLFISLFGAIGLVHLCVILDLARPLSVFVPSNKQPLRQLKRPNKPSKVFYLSLSVILVVGINLVFVPGLISQTTHSQEKIEAVDAIDRHAEAADREYPENFVLSNWGDSRMYNYFINGEARGYGYAQNNYNDFVISEDPDEWYDQFEGRVGYIVIEEIDQSPGATYSALYEDMGVGDDPPAHYQILAANEGTRTFAIVPGAMIQVEGSPGESIHATTTTDTKGMGSATYTRSAIVEEDGTAAIRVANPGSYVVGDNMSVEVNERAIIEGSEVPADSG